MRPATWDVFVVRRADRSSRSVHTDGVKSTLRIVNVVSLWSFITAASLGSREGGVDKLVGFAGLDDTTSFTTVASVLSSSKTPSDVFVDRVVRRFGVADSVEGKLSRELRRDA